MNALHVLNEAGMSKIEKENSEWVKEIFLILINVLLFLYSDVHSHMQRIRMNLLHRNRFRRE